MKSIIDCFPANTNMNAIIRGKSEKMKAASITINLINVFMISSFKLILYLCFGWYLDYLKTERLKLVTEVRPVLPELI